jgi:hypothetical protein
MAVTNITPRQRKIGISVSISPGMLEEVEKRVKELAEKGENRNVSGEIEAALQFYYGDAHAKSPRELILNHLRVLDELTKDGESSKQAKESIKIIREQLLKL